MSAAVITRRDLLQAGSVALGTAMVSVGIVEALAADMIRPHAFDPAAYVADLRAIDCQLHIWHPVRAEGMAGRWCYGIRSPGGRGFGEDFRLTMARWNAAIAACPDHGERVATHLAGVDGEAA